MTELLVSVRSVTEAEAALAGGANLIDVKEPSRGSLGRAPADTIGAVVAFINQRNPVSAALGELLEEPAPIEGLGLAYAKWGLAGCGACPDWRRRLEQAAQQLSWAARGCQAVAVAYVDGQAAKSPPVEEVIDFACERRWGAVLLDTWEKNGRSLLDWLPQAVIRDLCRRCRSAGVRIALAGSLRLEDVPGVLRANPDFVAVRGAVCRGGNRRGSIDAGLVRQIADVLLASRPVPEINSEHLQCR